MIADSFDSLAAAWADDPVSHEATLVALDNAVVAVPALADHRRYCEENQVGFGHRAFSGVWHLLAKELPTGFRFLEVGVHRGQSLSAVALAAAIEGKDCTVVGLGPLDGCGGYYELRDYEPDVLALFRRFNGEQRPLLIRGLSQDEKAKAEATALAPFDAVYIDADHELEPARHDFGFYSGLVRSGGYLIADDCGHGFDLFGWAFKGFEGASRAANELLPPKTPNPNWQHITLAMHMRIWRRL